jgi:predicted nucleotide-binding protein
VSNFIKKLAELTETGKEIGNYTAYDAWVARVNAFLTAALDEATAQAFKDLGGETTMLYWMTYLPRQIGYLEGFALKIEAKGLASAVQSNTSDLSHENTQHYSKKAFIVHGHDNEAKEMVARFVQKIGVDPIILHEQANEGRTIIEKFEVYADVGFAVILLTPDDIGATVSNKDNLQPRARQNVILELGYFMGKLTRKRVCALYKSGVEIPSDFQGVIYVELDSAGAWRTKLAQEFVQAGFSIDLQGLLHS